jgi:hypothetical protein
MAERRSGGKGGKRIPHHPLVEALASDPATPPEEATRLFGFPGPAADAGSTRLWLDLDLTSYVDVPDKAILHSQTLENDQGTMLWVEPEATLTYSTAQSQEVQADFLEGSIAAGNLSRAALRPGPGLAGGERARITIWSYVWHECVPQSELPPCRVSVNIPCLSRQLPCRTADFSCESRGIVCQTPAFPCQTDPPLCPEMSNLRCPSPGVPCIGERVVSPAGPCDEQLGRETPVVDPVGPFRARGGFRYA